MDFEPIVTNGSLPFENSSHAHFDGILTTILGPSTDATLRMTDKRQRRKLNLIKCDRCRFDKKDCTPTGRTWPNKCNRCDSRGFPCSEGNRVPRKTKHAAVLSRPFAATAAPETDYRPQSEIIIDEWIFQSSYLKIVGMALIQLRTLCKDLLEIGNSMESLEPPMKYFKGTPVQELFDFHHNLGESLTKSFNRFVKSGSSETSGRLSKIVMQDLLNRVHEGQCCICSETCEENHLVTLTRNGNIGGEFLARQHRWSMCVRQGCFLLNSCEADRDNEFRRIMELERIILAKLCSDSFHNVSSKGMPFRGAFHTSEVAEFLDERTRELDCLGRGPLLQWLDTLPIGDNPASIHYEINWPKENVNQQDILNRTLLHLACMKNWWDLVKRLLQHGADPYLTTHTGQLPLHYAAAAGRSEICKIILDHGRANLTMETPDRFGNSALFYAVNSRDYDTTKTLLEHPYYNNLSIQHSEDYSENKFPPPLIRAIEQNAIELVELLAKHGANFMVFYNGKTALDFLRDWFELMSLYQKLYYHDYSRWKALYESECRKEAERFFNENADNLE